MICLRVTVSGSEVASGLADDLEECALMLDHLAASLSEGDRQELAEYIENMDGMERERIAALGKLMMEAARG